MENNIKYSFILPIFNVEKYINKCIDSILNQKLGNYEIILVDDGSTDKCPNICDMYATNNFKIRVFHTKNGGISAARNKGLREAKGKYILFLDPDDYLESNYLEIIDNNIEDYDMLVFSYYNYYKNKKCKGYGINEIISPKTAMNYLVQRDKFCGYVWNKVFKKEIIDFFKIKSDVSVTMSEDILFSYQYLEKCSKNIKLISIPLVNYRQRKSSCLSKKIKDINASSLVKTFIYIINNSNDEAVVLKCKTLYLINYYKYRRYIKKDDFDLNLIKSIKRNDFNKIVIYDKFILYMYRFFPIFRTTIYKIRDFLLKKFD